MIEPGYGHGSKPCTPGEHGQSWAVLKKLSTSKWHWFHVGSLQRAPSDQCHRPGSRSTSPHDARTWQPPPARLLATACGTLTIRVFSPKKSRLVPQSPQKPAQRDRNPWYVDGNLKGTGAFHGENTRIFNLKSWQVQPLGAESQTKNTIPEDL